MPYCRKITYMGKEYNSIKELYELGIREYDMKGVSYQMFRNRLRTFKDTSPERLFTSQKLNSKRIIFKGKNTTVSEVAKEYGFSKQTLKARIKTGLSLEEALRIPIMGSDRPYTITSEGFYKYVKAPKELVAYGLPEDWFSKSLDDIFDNIMNQESRYTPHESTVEDFKGGFKFGKR